MVLRSLDLWELGGTGVTRATRSPSTHWKCPQHPSPWLRNTPNTAAGWLSLRQHVVPGRFCPCQLWTCPQPPSVDNGKQPCAPPDLPSRQKPRSEKADRGLVSQSTHLSSSSDATNQKILPGMSPSEVISWPNREHEVLREPQVQQAEARV